MKLATVSVSVRYQTQPELSLEDYKTIFPENIPLVFFHSIKVKFDDQFGTVTLFSSGIAVAISRSYEDCQKILSLVLSKIKENVDVFTSDIFKFDSVSTDSLFVHTNLEAYLGKFDFGSSLTKELEQTILTKFKNASLPEKAKKFIELRLKSQIEDWKPRYHKYFEGPKFERFRSTVLTLLLINHRIKLVVKDILLNILIPMIAKYEQSLLLQMESSGTIKIFRNGKICSTNVKNPVTMHLFCEHLREILN